MATLAALILGTLAAAAVYRSDFFGREAVSFLLVLPIALPGIVTGIALRSAIGGLESLFLLDDRDRSRHILRGRCLQQRAGAFQAHAWLADRSVHGLGRKFLPNLSLCCFAKHRHRPAGRRDACLRTVI